MPTSIRLQPEVEAKLDSLAQTTGRSKAFYLRRLVEDNIDDLIRRFQADAVFDAIDAGTVERVTIPDPTAEENASAGRRDRAAKTRVHKN